MSTIGEVDSKGHLELCEDPEAWIKDNPASRLALVTSLELCINGKEEIGESIGELTQLIRLEFCFCRSLKCVPANIGQLVSLTHLKLYSCNNIKFLPDSIVNLSNLTSLILSCCKSLVELPANIGQLVSLAYLNLYQCKNIKFLPDSTVNLSNLTSLILCCCQSLVELPANIGQLVNLTYLKLRKCKNIKFLPDSIVNLSNLTSLSLSSCDSLIELPENLDGLAHLFLLDIRFSSIKCLPWSITKIRKLQHLMLPKDFTLEALPYELNNSVIISVQGRHVRKSLGELKTEIGELPIPFGGEIGNDAAQYPSIISPPGYLRLKEDDPSQWIINNRNLLMLVRFLDLENVELTDSIMQFSELTHLYLYSTYDINYFVTFKRLTHLSLEFDESVIHSLSKLSNLQTLHLRSLESELSENFNMPVSLKHLSLSDCNMRPLYDSLEKLTNLRSLDLNSCDDCELLPPCKYIHKLRLVDCSFDSLDSLPIGLHHLEILFLKYYNDLRFIFEKCWNKLVNLETLSITCSKMEFFPEDIARLHNLQKLQLKDCISLEKLPSNLHELVNLHTLDISVTRIKTLPLSFIKQCKLQHLTLPKCFNMQSLPGILKIVSVIDDKEEAYCKCMNYDASLYQTSADISDESKDEETELGVVHGESCNEDDYLVPTVEIHETVPDEQTSADPFNSISIGSIDENIQHTALCSQNQFNPLGNGGFMTNRPGADFFGVNNQHVINDGQFDNMTLENEHGISSICQNISSWDGNSIVGGWNNHHVLDLGLNNNSQSYHANVIRKEKEITPEAILEQLPRFVNAAEKHDDFCSSWSETPNPEGESIPAIRNDQNDITTMLIEQDNGENSHHDLENGQKQVPQHNKVERNNRTEISEEKLQQCWSENPMSLQETAEKIFGVSRSTMKRRLKELKLLWPSSKKGKQHLDDAKKRKHNSKAPFGCDSTQQNLVIPTNSTAQVEIVWGRIIGANQLTLPNHVSSNSDVVDNLAPDTIVESVRGNLMDTQGNMHSQYSEEHYLDGANDHGHLEGVLHTTESNHNLAATLETFKEPLMVIESHMDTHQQAQGHLEGALHSNESNRAATRETFDPMVIESHMDIQQQVQGHLKGALHTTESSGTIVVKATYKELSVRIVFSLTLPINQLIEEIGMKFQLELNKYRLLYQDEDKEWMMLTSVEDLKYASNVAESLRTKFVRLSVIDCCLIL